MHIPPKKLEIIEQALLLQGNWDEALKVVKWVRGIGATPELIQRATEMYGSDDIEIDDDASVSEATNGAWVQAWVWVPGATDDDDD
jgi:hypothetical protein